MSFMSKSQDQKKPVSGPLIRSTIREPFFYPSIAPFYFAERKINRHPLEVLSVGRTPPGRFLVQVWNRATGLLRDPAALFQTRKIKARTLIRFLRKSSPIGSEAGLPPLRGNSTIFQRCVNILSSAPPRASAPKTGALSLLRAKTPTNLKRPWFFRGFQRGVNIRSSAKKEPLSEGRAAKSKGTNSYLIPDFVEIQRKSFFQLLENGLIEEFAKRNPITNKNLEIFFYPEYYQLTPPEYNPRRAILLSKSYSSKLFIPAQLTDKKLKKSQLKWVLIGNLPLMTKRGHFVLNGAPRVIVNQILRSPGIYFQGSLKEIFSDQWSEKAEITYKRFYTDLICLRGTWLRIEIDKNKDVWAQMKKVPKIPLLWFLLAMGLTERIIFKSVINPTRLLANFNPEIKRKIDYEYVTNASDAWKEISNLISSSNKESYAAFSTGLLKGSSEATLEGKNEKKQPSCIAKKGLLPSSFVRPLFYKIKSATIFGGAKNESKFFKKSSSFNFGLKKKNAFCEPLVIQGGLATQFPLLGRSELFPFAFFEALPNKFFQNQPLPLRQPGGPSYGQQLQPPPGVAVRRTDPISRYKADIYNIGDPRGQRAKKKAAVLRTDASSSLGSYLRTGGKTPRSGLNKGHSAEKPIWVGFSSKRSSFLNIVEHSKEGRNWIFKRFMNPRAYDLGGQGRLNFNRKLGLSIDSNQTTLTAQDLLFATDYLFKVEKGLKNIDDIDHLKNRRVRTSGELLQIQIGIGLVRLEKIIREKLSKINAQTRASDFLTLTKGPSLLLPQNTQKKGGSVTQGFAGPSKKTGVYNFAHRRKQPLFALFSLGTVKTKAQKDVRRTLCDEHFSGESYKATQGVIPTLSQPSLGLAEKPNVKQPGGPSYGQQLQGVAGVAVRRTDLISRYKAYIYNIGDPLYMAGAPPSEAAPLVSKKGGPGKSKKGLQGGLVSLALTGFQAPLGGSSYGQQTRSCPSDGRAQTEEFKMNNLINTKAFNGALREFFGSSQLSQFMDQLNPLAEITHKRRLSSMGPGGVTRDSATLAIRGIHPTHYGRICPIETPEGKTVGLTNSLTTYARANPQGFLESPFFKVYKGQIQKSAGMFFLTAGQEENTKIAAADVGGSSYGQQGAFGRMDFLPKNKIPAKIAYGDTISKISRDQVEYIGVSPIQMISIATSLIPFVEHDDANRALMGSNMQRQAVPLVRAERPLVGTGLESRTVSDSGHAVIARESGYVAYVSGKKMIIYAIPIHS